MIFICGTSLLKYNFQPAVSSIISISAITLQGKNTLPFISGTPNSLLAQIVVYPAGK
jgi:hypothetical protein